MTPAIHLLKSSVIPDALKSTKCEAKLKRVSVSEPKIITKGAGIVLGQNSNSDTSDNSNKTSSINENGFVEGDSIEICPLSIAACEEIADRIVRSGGASLLIDYGEDYMLSDSIRGFKKHTQVDILSEVCYNVEYIVVLFSYFCFTISLD